MAVDARDVERGPLVRSPRPAGRPCRRGGGRSRGGPPDRVEQGLLIGLSVQPGALVDEEAGLDGQQTPVGWWTCPRPRIQCQAVAAVRSTAARRHAAPRRAGPTRTMAACERVGRMMIDQRTKRAREHSRFVSSVEAFSLGVCGCCSSHTRCGRTRARAPSPLRARAVAPPPRGRRRWRRVPPVGGDALVDTAGLYRYTYGGMATQGQKPRRARSKTEPATRRASLCSLCRSTSLSLCSPLARPAHGSLST